MIDPKVTIIIPPPFVVRAIVANTVTDVTPPPEMTTIVSTSGATGPQGPTGPQGIPGLSGAGYIHTQPTPATTWTVSHNLGFRPDVAVTSPGGLEVEASVLHLSTNVTQIDLLTAMAGTARFV